MAKEEEEKPKKKALGARKPFIQWGDEKKCTADWRYKAVLGTKVLGFECSESEFDEAIEAAGNISLS